MQLSEHLELAEVIRSSTAKRLGISNMPTEEHLANLKIWAEKIYEPIWNHFKKCFLSSGYRSKQLNAVTKGASATSQHSTGEAGDIDMDGTEIKNSEIFYFVLDNLEFDQLIYEYGNDENPDWVHVSYETSGKPQRKQVLKCVRVNGEPKYIPFVDKRKK
jgi:zinc D-Ala-D-Ala carboxypeptidase